MDEIIIENPRGVLKRLGSGKFELKWAPDFQSKTQRQFNSAQAFIDSESIRHMKDYTPMRNGILYKSATLGTEIGSGSIMYAAPYARYQYYGKLMVSRKTGSSYARKKEKKILTDKDLVYSKARHRLAGAYWFERMKADKLTVILRGAAKLAGGSPG